MKENAIDNYQKNWATLSLEASSTAQQLKYTLSTADNTVIGRSPDCQIPLDPDRFTTVSRRHAEIKLVNANWQINDLGTTNGTFINHQKIDRPKLLKSGDIITLGINGAKFTFECLRSIKADIPKQLRSPAIAQTKPEKKRGKAVINATISESNIIQPVRQSNKIPIASSTKTFWNLISIAELCQIPGHPHPVLGLSFSPNGQMLASSAKDKTIKLWNIANQTEIATLTGDKFAPKAIAFSPDGKTLASGGADKTIKLWNIADRSPITSFAAHKLAINALAFSPDGKTLASGGADKTIKLWQVDVREEIASIVGHKLAIQSLAFSSDGQTLGSGSKDRTIKLWNIASKEEVAIFTGHRQGVNAIAFSPDGQIIASVGADYTIKLWNRKAQAEIAAISTPNQHTPSRHNGAIAIAPDGQTLAASDEQGAIRLWQI